MRRLIIVGVLSSGCFTENPAWQSSSAGTSGGEASSSSTMGGETMGAPPTTSGDGEGTGTGGATTSGGVSTTTGVEPTTTGVEPTTTGVDPTTGAPGPKCEATELRPVALAPEKIEDTGVAPASMVPCAWNGACEQLNFGETHYFRLVSTPGLGKTVGLYRFNVGSIAEWAESEGIAVEDLVGFEFAVVVYEPRDLPAVTAILQVDAVAQADVDFSEGGGDADVAVDGDSSGACKTRVEGACIPWSAGLVDAASVTVGTIVVDEAAVVEHDYDGEENGRYHALLRTGTMPIETILAVSGDGAPTFAVSLMTERGLAPEMEIGIKFEDSPEPDPVLYAVVCKDEEG